MLLVVGNVLRDVASALARRNRTPHGRV